MLASRLVLRASHEQGGPAHVVVGNGQCGSSQCPPDLKQDTHVRFDRERDVNLFFLPVCMFQARLGVDTS